MSLQQMLLAMGGNQKINLTISANTQQYDIFSAAGSPAAAVDVTLTVNSGVRVGDVSAGTYAMRTGSAWAAGSTIYILNNGTIQGIGGNGGNGNAPVAAGSPGGAGNTALLLNWPVSIENGSGFIYGGGGGGGGGGSSAASPTPVYNGDGGGGGRSANTNSTGGTGFAAGTAGTASAAGTGGNTGGNGGAGGNGGDVGVAGSSGAAGSGAAGGAGGAAGKAIKTNSNAITWISGNDATHVKGAVSA